MHCSMNHMPVPRKIAPMLPDELATMSKYSMDVSRDMYWKGLRSTANSIFHNVETLQSFCPLVKETATELAQRLDKVGEGESVDIWRALGDMTLDVVGTCVFGVRFDCIQNKGTEAVRAARTIFRVNIASPTWNPYLSLGILLPPFLIPPLTFLGRRFPTAAMREVDWAMDVLARLSEAMVEDATKRNPSLGSAGNGGNGGNGGDGDRTNFLKLFVRAHNRESGALLSKDEVKAQALLYLLAGYETTANTLSSAVYLLSTNKDKERLLVEEIDGLGVPASSADLKAYTFAEGVVKEALRLFGPVPFTDRQAAERLELKAGGGLTVLPGQVVHISMRDIHRNAAYWPDPLMFLPERFIKGSPIYGDQNHHAFLAWGLGPRMCVAADFALMEAKLALVNLYSKFTFEYTGEKPFKQTFGGTLGPEHGVRVYVHKRQKT